MSRSNPYKKKRHAAQKSLLIYGEGLREEQFLKCLRHLYSRNRNINVKIQKGAGGSLEQLVIQASRIPGDFDKRVVVVDDDKGQKEMDKARIEAKKKQIKIFTHTPCLEALLLSILNDGLNYTNKTSTWCKSKFGLFFKKKDNPIDIEDFIASFKKPLLDKKRKTISELNRIILLLEGC